MNLNHEKIIMTIIYQICIILIFVPEILWAEITIDSYCQLSIQCLQQEASNFQELVTLVTQYQNDREALNQKEEIKKVKFAQARDALFASFGITDTEYGTYMGENGAAVNTYLAENPSIKQEVADLSAQVNTLMEQYETLKGVEETSELPADAPALQE